MRSKVSGVSGHMLRKAYTPLSMVLETLAFLLGGILLLSNPEGTMRLLSSIIYLLIWLSALLNIFRWIFRRSESRSSLWYALLLLAFAVFLSSHPSFLTSSFSLVCAIWIILNAVARGLYAVQLLQTKSRGWIRTMVQGGIYIAFAVAILGNLTNGAVSLHWLLGIYCLIRFAFGFADSIREILGLDLRGKRIKQRIRLKPPVIVSALMPMRLLRALDDPDEEAEVTQWTRKETILEGRKPDMEIYLHLGKNVANGFGHMDIALGDRIYTYGCYDSTTNRLFGALSDGVLISAVKQQYIDFCLHHAQKRLIGYGVVLTDEQKKAIHNKIDEFLQISEPWQPGDQNPDQKLLEQDADAKFYKIKKGPFKIYNVWTTNCVAMANILSGSGGVDLMNPQGIITPGTYAEFLDRQFLRKKSIVISRTVYR